MSIIKLTSAAVLALPVILSACGGDDDRPQTSSTTYSTTTAQPTMSTRDERIYSRELRK